MVVYVAAGGVSDVDLARLATVRVHAATNGSDSDCLEAVKVHLSGGPWEAKEGRLSVADTGYPHVLMSFIYDQEGRFFPDRLGYWPLSCLGDSGAFTVWTKGDTVDVDAYAAWCLAYLEKRPDFRFINLDVIPGTAAGKAPTRPDRERAMVESMENADRLRAAGVPVIEVVHMHEPIEYLDQLVARRRPGELIGAGGLAGGGSRTAKVAFCDSVFSRLRELAGGWKDLVPVHGLGIAPDSPLATRYPWWSVDSSSWLNGPRFGMKIDSSGKRAGDDERVANGGVRRLYLQRVLRAWTAREAALTKMWEGRGVRYADGL